MDNVNISEKNRLVALLLCIFGGYLGLHQFYVGKIGKGFLYFFTLGLLGIGWFLDTCKLIFGNFEDSTGAILKFKKSNKEIIKNDNNIKVNNNIKNDNNIEVNNNINNKDKPKINWPWVIAIVIWIIGLCNISTNTLLAVISFIIGVLICPITDGELKKYDFYKNNKVLVIIAAVIIWIIGAGYNPTTTTTNDIVKDEVPSQEIAAVDEVAADNGISELKTNEASELNTNEVVEEKVVIDTTNRIALSEIQPYSDSPYIEVNGNIPFFDDSELTTESFEKYSDLDSIGRAGIATACIEKGMDDKPRGDISKVNPTGWQTTKYDGIDGGNLYNRCHIIANQLTGEDANEKNLMTGTRYFNTQGMERFENQVAEYIDNTDNHVLYRVTPMFENDDLVAKGVLIEAKSVEDNGKGVQFNVFCYNVQPGIEIDYKTGNSKKNEEEKTQSTVNPAAVAAPVAAASVVSQEKKEQSSSSSTPKSSTPTSQTTSPSAVPAQPTENVGKQTYILNTNRKKFHYPWCSSVNQMKEKNKREYTGTRDGAISQGYSPCGKCNP